MMSIPTLFVVLAGCQATTPKGETGSDTGTPAFVSGLLGQTWSVDLGAAAATRVDVPPLASVDEPCTEG